MKKEEVSKFYDDYVEKQVSKGYNERHLVLNDYLMNEGIHGDSSILELGCGVGTITSLIKKTVSKGKMVCVDISEKSIEQSKSINYQKNIEFIVSDLLSFKYDKFSFNFITLFDVLEHVPVEQHFSIFQNITNYMDENSKLIIHVPTKEIIKYNEKNCPELMQIIDQPLAESELISSATKAGLRLTEFKFTNIWEHYDYQLFVFGLPFEFDKSKKIHRKVSFMNRLKNKIK